MHWKLFISNTKRTNFNLNMNWILIEYHTLLSQYPIHEQISILNKWKNSRFIYCKKYPKTQATGNYHHFYRRIFCSLQDYLLYKEGTSETIHDNIWFYQFSKLVVLEMYLLHPLATMDEEKGRQRISAGFHHISIQLEMSWLTNMHWNTTEIQPLTLTWNIN